LILFATSSVEKVCGQRVEDIVGRSFFSLLPGGDDTVAPQTIAETDPTSPIASVFASLNATVSGQSSSGAVTLRHPMFTKSGNTVQVFTIFYLNGCQSNNTLVSSSDLSNTGNRSEDSRSSCSSSSPNNGLKRNTIEIQVKVISDYGRAGGFPLTIASATNARPVVHAPTANVFEELETTRGTSWQYELHQLRLLNRRLKDDIATAQAKVAGSGIEDKGKRRNVEVDDADVRPPDLPLLEQYNRTPRHQLAPAFGFVPPGVPSPFL
jgi:hypothetical protein